MPPKYLRFDGLCWGRGQNQRQFQLLRGSPKPKLRFTCLKTSFLLLPCLIERQQRTQAHCNVLSALICRSRVRKRRVDPSSSGSETFGLHYVSSTNSRMEPELVLSRSEQTSQSPLQAIGHFGSLHLISGAETLDFSVFGVKIGAW